MSVPSTGPTIAKAVIPAAGLGTRLRPATKAQPKEMLPIGRQPVIQYVYDELAAFGVSSVLIVTGRDKRAIEDHFDDDAIDPQQPEILYIRQSVPRGLGDAVSMARAFASDGPFVVALGDTTLGAAAGARLLSRMAHAFQRARADMAIAVQPVAPNAVSRYGIVAPRGEASDEAFLISDIVEKPSPEDAPSRLAVAARYIFSPGVFDLIDRTPPGLNGEVQITDAIRLCVRGGGTVVCVPYGPGDRRHDVGNFESYFKAFIRMAADDTEIGPQIRGFMQELLGEYSPPDDSPA